MKELYANSDSEESFFDWISLYFNETTDGEYTTKPKPRYYTLIGETLIKAFEEKGIDTFLKPIENKSTYLDSPIVNAKYNMIYMSDERLKYSVGWESLTSLSNRFAGWTEYETPKYYYSYPLYPQGIAFARQGGLTVDFKTSADAIYVSYLTVIDYSVPANIFVDGKQVGEMTTYDSGAKDKHCITNSFPVTDLEEKTVTITTTKGGGFRICAIIEEFTE